MSLNSKPRILILIHYLEIGGAEISLIGLLGAIDKSRYDVDLFVYSHQGELMKLIPDGVNLLPEIKKYSTVERPMKQVLKEGYVDIVAARMLAKLQAAHYYRQSKSEKENYSIFHYLFRNVTPLLPAIMPEVEYDLAIGFLSPFHILRDKVRAKKKIGWIHTDFNVLEINRKAELPVWDSCDYIASISPAITESFIKVFPALARKIVLIENILSPAFVRSRAEEFDAEQQMPHRNQGINLLSIGRFCAAKNYDNLPFICKYLVDGGIDIRWYIIGFGGDEELIRRRIVEAGMEKHVIILGKKTNPYPYIKACDIYVQPSRYEGKSVTVREAQMLYKPVVATAYPTASSQIRNGADGIIVPMDNRGCAEGIKAFIENAGLRARIVEYLKTHDFGNESEVNKIYKLI